MRLSSASNLPTLVLRFIIRAATNMPDRSTAAHTRAISPPAGRWHTIPWIGSDGPVTVAIVVGGASAVIAGVWGNWIGARGLASIGDWEGVGD